MLTDEIHKNHCITSETKDEAHHPVHARNNSRPKSDLCLAKLNMNVYIITVGSATPKISNGCPPIIECIIPQTAVDAKVCTAVKTPSAILGITLMF